MVCELIAFLFWLILAFLVLSKGDNSLFERTVMWVSTCKVVFVGIEIGFKYEAKTNISANGIYEQLQSINLGMSLIFVVFVLVSYTQKAEK